jgi:quinolinate synthase
MFALGFAAQQQGRGVVGSTSNILAFIARKVDEAVAASRPCTLRFVLGTESGMTTAIAHEVRQKLAAARAAGAPEVSVEIVFPVAAEAVATTTDASLPILPGVLAGEGCSTAGGCATCPYMKMNSLDALLQVLGALERGERAALLPYAPKSYASTLDGHTVAELGGRSIVYMRAFQKTGELPPELGSALGLPAAV